jgi:hypothetical protein
MASPVPRLQGAQHSCSRTGSTFGIRLRWCGASCSGRLRDAGSTGASAGLLSLPVAEDRRRRRLFDLGDNELADALEPVGVRVVDLHERGPFIGERVLGEDCFDRALGFACAAVDTFLRVDHEHAVALVNAVDGADVDASPVLHVDAGFGDDVGQEGISSSWVAEDAAFDPVGQLI